MKAWAFRAALRASAKVALGVTVAGCGGSVAVTPEAGPVGTADAAAAVLPPDARPVPTVEGGALSDALACNPPPASELLPEGLHVDAGASIDRATFDCCVAAVAAFGPSDAGVSIGELPDAGEPGAEVTACCAAIVARLDYEERTMFGAAPDASTWIADERTAGAVRWACCAAVGEPEGATCTPWGPPVPPAMPAHLLEVA